MRPVTPCRIASLTGVEWKFPPRTNPRFFFFLNDPPPPDIYPLPLPDALPICSPFGRRLRRFLVTNFPYVLLYRVEPERIYIAAAMHLPPRPANGRPRL